MSVHSSELFLARTPPTSPALRPFLHFRSFQVCLICAATVPTVLEVQADSVSGEGSYPGWHLLTGEQGGMERGRAGEEERGNKGQVTSSFLQGHNSI